MTTNEASQLFGDYTKLAYWLAWKRIRRCEVPDREELVQDAVARGYGKFARRCSAGEPDDVKDWVCQCVLRGIQDALRNISRFGSPSSNAAIWGDVMNRLARACHDCLDVEYVPAPAPVQRWELEQLAERELPKKLRATAVNAAMGLTQRESAALQGVSERTIRYRLEQIVKTLCCR